MINNEQVLQRHVKGVRNKNSDPTFKIKPSYQCTQTSCLCFMYSQPCGSNQLTYA